MTQVCLANRVAQLLLNQLRRFPHNIRAIMAKIKLPKNPLSMVLFWIKVRRSY